MQACEPVHGGLQTVFGGVCVEVGAARHPGFHLPKVGVKLQKRGAIGRRERNGEFGKAIVSPPAEKSVQVQEAGFGEGVPGPATESVWAVVRLPFPNACSAVSSPDGEKFRR